MAIRTIFSMIDDCGHARRAGWEEFVRDYAGMARRLLEQYFPTLSPEVSSEVTAVFRRARAADCKWFNNLHISNEREFLMAFRDLVFAHGREVARVPAPQLSLDQLRNLMQDLPLVDREMLWMFVKGYSADQIAPMVMNASATAQAVKDVADERLRRLVPGSTPDALAISARVLLEAAENARTPECLSLKVFNNIINGQISWRERELAEEHMLRCFHCMDRFTTFQEMVRLRKDTPSLSAAEIAAILSQLDLPPAKRENVLARLFSRA